MKGLRVLLFVIGVLLTAVAFGQKPAIVTSDDPGWHKIGEITASFDLDTESIVVLGADEFQAIKLKVTDAPINIERVQVHYESGEVEDVDLADNLQAGAETRSIALEHGDRDIQKVSFTYQTVPNYTGGDRAHVELYGYKSGESDQYRNDGNLEEKIDKAQRDIDESAEKAEEKIERESDELKRDMRDDADTTGSTGEKLKDGFNRSTAVIGAEIKDKVFADKVGPNGETIYIDEHSKYYYIDRDGDKKYITKLEMKNKPVDDDNR